MEEKNYESIQLKNQLCFPLYAASRETIRLYKPYLDELELTYTQYISMMVLWERKSVTVKELGKELYLDSGTLTPLLKKLENKGLLTRKRSAEDERNLIVTVTEAGEALKDKALSVRDKMAAKVCLTAEESLTMYHLLYKLLSGVEDTRDG